MGSCSRVINRADWDVSLPGHNRSILSGVVFKLSTKYQHNEEEKKRKKTASVYPYVAAIPAKQHAIYRRHRLHVIRRITRTELLWQSYTSRAALRRHVVPKTNPRKYRQQITSAKNSREGRSFSASLRVSPASSSSDSSPD